MQYVRFAIYTDLLTLRTFWGSEVQTQKFTIITIYISFKTLQNSEYTSILHTTSISLKNQKLRLTCRVTGAFWTLSNPKMERFGKITIYLFLQNAPFFDLWQGSKYVSERIVM